MVSSKSAQFDNKKAAVQIFSIKSRWLVVLGIFIGIGLGGCDSPIFGDGAIENDDQPQVVSTSTIIADLTIKVGEDRIEHTSILQPGTDPHVYEPTPQDSVALEQADLILYNGYNLEPGLIRLINAAGIGGEKFAVGEVVTPLFEEEEGQQQPDPHVWGDAKNAIAMVEAIRDKLIELSPEDEQEFTANATQLIEQLQSLDSWIVQQIETIPENQRRLVTTHDAFQYYANAYGLEVTGTLIGISTEEQPSAQTVKNLANAIRKANVPAIFAETTINPQLIQTVAAEAGVELAPRELYSDSIGAPGSEGDSYINMMVANTRTIVEALGGEYQDFEFSNSDN
jgi:manganese/iron transport system substrate-binding protein